MLSTAYDPAELLAWLPPVPEPEVIRASELGPYEPTLAADLVPPPSPTLLAILTTEHERGTRSEACMAAATRMLHEGYTREQVAGVMYHPDNPISGHVFDQPDPRRAAERVASRAKAPPRAEEIFTNYRPPILTGFEGRQGGVLMADQQQKHFAGCIYISSLCRVLMPDGQMLDEKRFNARMGGYRFLIDNEGEKTVTNAWTAFLNNERFKAPEAVNTCFRPELPPLAFVNEDGWPRVNAYVPIETRAVEGDASPFVKHIELMYPKDASILLSYLARVVQNPGLKAQYWPVLQSTKGAGKSMFTEIMQHCIGTRYFHTTDASKLTRRGMNFNGWLRNKLFLTVEEIPEGPNTRQFFEEFKTLVTNPTLAYEPKGVEESIGDNRCNGMIFTNYQGAVPIDVNERRYCILQAAQQSHEDMLAAGMDADYFHQFWSWLRADGFAVINHFLRTYEPDPRYDPLLQARAPRTSSTDAAIKASLGSMEQILADAIEDGVPGLRGGWVSTIIADTILRQKYRGTVAPKTLAACITRLGYVRVMEGPTSRQVQPDNGRPRLYCRPDMLGMSDPVTNYERAQLDTPVMTS